MKRSTFPLHPLFGIIGAGLWLASAFVSDNQTLDIHLHDTYFILAISLLLRATGILFLLAWLLYFLLRRRRTAPLLTWLHLLLFALGVIALLSSNWAQPSLRRYADLSSVRNWQTVVGIALLAIALSQVLFVVNLVLGIVRGKKK